MSFPADTIGAKFPDTMPTAAYDIVPNNEPLWDDDFVCLEFAFNAETKAPDEW